MRDAVNAVLIELDRMAKPVTCKDHVAQIASVASNNDPDITRILVDIYENRKHQLSSISIGTTERTYYDKPQLEFLQGYSWDQGFLSPYFTTDKAKTTVEYGNSNQEHNDIAGAYVLLTDYPPESESDLRRILEFAAKLLKPIILIAPEFRADALTALVVNHLQNRVRVCAIKTPIEEQDPETAGGDLSVLKDIAAFTGAQIVSRAYGMRLGKVDPVQVLGKVNAIQVSNRKTVLIGGGGRVKHAHEEVTGLEARVLMLEGYLSENPLVGDF